MTSSDQPDSGIDIIKYANIDGVILSHCKPAKELEDIRKELEKEGINLAEIAKGMDGGLEPMTLIDVKDGGDHVIISLE